MQTYIESRKLLDRLDAEKTYTVADITAIIKHLSTQTAASKTKFIDVNRYSISEGLLYDWYISSIDSNDDPKWTLDHLGELQNDFYLIPKRNEIMGDIPVLLCMNCK